MKTIDAQELDAIMERDDAWVLVDALPEESYERRHIAGAHSVPAVLMTLWSVWRRWSAIVMTRWWCTARTETARCLRRA